MRMKDHELHPLPQHTQTHIHTEYNKLTGEGVRWMSQWVGALGWGVWATGLGEPTPLHLHDLQLNSDLWENNSSSN